jgi:hypothetical protein
MARRARLFGSFLQREHDQLMDILSPPPILLQETAPLAVSARLLDFSFWQATVRQNPPGAVSCSPAKTAGQPLLTVQTGAGPFSRPAPGLFTSHRADRGQSGKA